jgi:hypothetical protein
MRDNQNEPYVGEILEGDDRRQFLDWCQFMLGMNRAHVGRLIFVQEHVSQDLNLLAWSLFDDWLAWQEDFYRVSQKENTPGV